MGRTQGLGAGALVRHEERGKATMQLSASLLPSLPVPPQRGGAVCQPAPQLWRPGSPRPCCQDLSEVPRRPSAQRSRAERSRSQVWEDEPIQGPVPHCHPAWKEGSSTLLFPHSRPGREGTPAGGPSLESWEELKKGQRSRAPTPLLSEQLPPGRGLTAPDSSLHPTQP